MLWESLLHLKLRQHRILSVMVHKVGFSSKAMVFMVDFINETRSSRRLVVESYLDYECRGDYSNR
jgi:hypothetical protein